MAPSLSSVFQMSHYILGFPDFVSPLRYDNGDFYEGGFRRGMRSGRGLFVSRDGLEYKGDFSKNLCVQHTRGEKMIRAEMVLFRCRSA